MAVPLKPRPNMDVTEPVTKVSMKATVSDPLAHLKEKPPQTPARAEIQATAKAELSDVAIAASLEGARAVIEKKKNAHERHADRLLEEALSRRAESEANSKRRAADRAAMESRK